MKTINFFLCFFVLIFGIVITAAIDYIIGVSFADIGMVTKVTHKTIYVLFGVAFFNIYKFFKVLLGKAERRLSEG